MGQQRPQGVVPLARRGVGRGQRWRRGGDGGALMEGKQGEKSEQKSQRVIWQGDGDHAKVETAFMMGKHTMFIGGRRERNFSAERPQEIFVRSL